MPRKDKEHCMPETFKSNTSFANSTILSINKSPNSNIPSDIRLPGVNPVSADIAYDGNADKCSDSNSEEDPLDEFRASVFEYPEWVTLCDLNDAGGDDNCDNSTKASTKQPKHGWRCNFCQQTFIGRNATKAICHLAGVKGMNIQKFRGIIPEKHMKVIRARNAIRSNKVDNMSKFNTKRNENMLRQQQSIVAGLEMMAQNTGRSRAVSSTYGSDSVLKYNEKQLDVAICDLIYSKGLPFNLTKSHHLKRVLQLAKSVSSKYNPPTRKRISTELLHVTYKNRISEYKESLHKEAQRFRLSFYGDRATVCKMSMINIMASGVHERSAVLDIVETTNHLADGGTKNAEYIAELFVPHINEIDPKGMFVDSVFFDGASNVQKAGRILAAKFPSITVMHGAEHVLSLFFSNLGRKIPMINQMIKIYRKLYSIFGSGSHHQPHAIFRKSSTMHFRKFVGMIRAADTRMAGYFIAFARFLRLKTVLKQTINSTEFIESVKKNGKSNYCNVTAVIPN